MVGNATEGQLQPKDVLAQYAIGTRHLVTSRGDQFDVIISDRIRDPKTKRIQELRGIVQSGQYKGKILKITPGMNIK